jgi:hypothetical protein
MWSAWVLVGLYIGYGAAVAASGVANGPPRDPAWAVAEILTIVGAPIQVALFGAIYECVPRRDKLAALLAFAWMTVMAALTTTVHFVSLVVARRIEFATVPSSASVFDFSRRSLLLGIELWAWHFWFGLSLVAASWTFRGQGLALLVRLGLRVGGVLCLLGLLGPATDIPSLRLIGVVGYGAVFPIVCALIGFRFRAARERETGERPQRTSLEGLTR